MSYSLGVASEFEYEKLARHIDGINNTVELRQLLKDYIKLNLKQREVWNETIKGLL